MTPETVKQYVDQGWAVVPVRAGSKKAATSWQREVYGPQDFGPADNIAFKCGQPSGWRVDVDCDALEAVHAARLLMPNTGIVHGRPGKPDSHYWYQCEGMKTTQFTDIKGADDKAAMIVEVRSTGGYTVVPPSTWTSKDDGHQESISWSHQRLTDLATLNPDDLTQDVRDVAIAALLARHWPGHGARHAVIGPLTGFLLQAGVVHAVRIVMATVEVAGDNDPDDRRKSAQATDAKFRKGERVTGGPTLTDHLGEDVVRKLRSWLRLKDEDALDRMNEKHFIVRLAADTVIGREESDEIVFQKRAALELEYANRPVQVGVNGEGEAKFAPLFDTWLKSPQRRQYKKVVFAPPPLQANEQDFNLWRGFTVQATEYREDQFRLAVPLLHHVRHIICGDDPAYYDYLVNLLALTVQRPGERSQVAVAMRGLEGAGKTLLMDWFGRLFHRDHYIHLDKANLAIGRFNKAIAGKVVVYLDEAFWAGNKDQEGALKNLITGETLMIEPKGLDAFEVNNFAHVFASSNKDWVVPAGQNSRRWFVLDVDNRYAFERATNADRQAYFAPLFHAMANGGREGLLYFLQRRNLDRFDRFNIPTTDALIEQRQRSLTGIDRWLVEVATAEAFGPMDGMPGALSWDPHADTIVNDVYRVYDCWCRRRGERAVPTPVFGKMTDKVLWQDKSRNTKRFGTDVRVRRLRTPADVRAMLPTLQAQEVEILEERIWSDGRFESVVSDRSDTISEG